VSELRLRLIQVRDALGLSQTAFAQQLNVKRPTLIGYETGKAPPSAELLEAIRVHYRVDINWLLTGEGEMFHSETFEEDAGLGSYGQTRTTVLAPIGNGDNPAFMMLQPDLTLRPANGDSDPSTLALVKRWGYPEDVTVYKYRKGHGEPVPVAGPDPEGVVFIPVYSQTVDAGPGQEATQLVETEEMAPVLYALCQGHDPGRCGICRVVGDSMTDVTLFNGDYVVFDKLDIRGDGIFVIGMYGEMRVKRLQYRLADRKIVIASENAKRYPEPEIVSAEVAERGELKIYGRVLGWLHRHPY